MSELNRSSNPSRKGDAQALKDQYDIDLAQLQADCRHLETHWAMEMWAPGHFGSRDFAMCDNCWKIVGERPITWPPLLGKANLTVKGK